MRKIFILSLLAMMIAWGIGGCGGGGEGTSADPLGTDSLMFGLKKMRRVPNGRWPWRSIPMARLC